MIGTTRGSFVFLAGSLVEHDRRRADEWRRRHRPPDDDPVARPAASATAAPERHARLPRLRRLLLGHA
jgi:hypothetical protein